jgi:hypothetical protein
MSENVCRDSNFAGSMAFRRVFLYKRNIYKWFPQLQPHLTPGAMILIHFIRHRVTNFGCKRELFWLITSQKDFKRYFLYVKMVFIF